MGWRAKTKFQRTGIKKSSQKGNGEMTKRIFSLLLVITMLMSICSVNVLASASDGGNGAVAVEDTSTVVEQAEDTGEPADEGSTTPSIDAEAEPDQSNADTAADAEEEIGTPSEDMNAPQDGSEADQTTDAAPEATAPAEQAETQPPVVDGPSIEDPAMVDEIDLDEDAGIALAEVDNVASAGGQEYETLAEAITNANGQEVKLLKEITIADAGSGYGMAITKDVTIDLASNTITIENTSSKDNFMGIDFQSSSGSPVNVTLKNGTIKMDSSQGTAIMLFSANLTLSGINMTSNATAVTVMNITAPSTLTVGGGSSITAVRPVQHHGAQSGTTATNTVKVEGGNLTATGSYAAINDTDNKGSALDVTITSGSVNGSASAAGILLMSNGTINVNGGSVSGSSGIVMTNGTLNVNNGTITANGLYNANGGDRPDQGIDEDGSAIMIISGATGSIGGGNVKVNVTNGSITSTNGYAMHEITAKTATGGEGTMEATVSGGTFTGGASVEKAAIATTSDKNTSVSGGKFSSSVDGYVNADSSVTAKVGEGLNPYIVGEDAIKAAAAELPEGTVDVLKGNIAFDDLQEGVVVKNSATGEVTVNGETVNQDNQVTVHNPSLQELITEAAAQSGTVTLQKNYDENITIAEGQTVTIDLNGHTIKGSGGDTITVGKNANLTIQDSDEGGTITVASDNRTINNKGTVTINGGTVTREEGADKYVIVNDGTSEPDAPAALYLYGGAVKSNAATAACIYNDGGTINMGGDIVVEAKSAPILNNSCDSVEDVNLYIAGGTITCTGEGPAIMNMAMMEISAGNITGDVVTVSGDGEPGDDNCVGKTTISGGTITGNVTCGPAEDGLMDEKAPTVSVSDTAVVHGELYPVKMQDSGFVRDDGQTAAKFEVSGGTFDKEVKAAYIVPGTTEAKVKETYYVGQSAIMEQTGSLTSGDTVEVVTGDLALEDLPDGVTVKNNGQGTVTANGENVETGGGSVTIQPITLQKLIDDAQDGETVQLDKSYNENIVIPDGKTITIDLNGQTITGSAADTIVIGKGATVIIKDSQPGNYGTVTNTGNFRTIVNKGTLTLDGGTYTREDGTNNYVIFNDGCSEAGVVGNLTLQRGIVKSNSTKSSCICNDEGFITASSYITVEAAYNPIKNNACAQAGKGKITISGATIKCTNPENSFAIQNNAELVIESGSITGDVTTLSGDGMEGEDSYIGKTTITGGHITGDVSCGPAEPGLKPENAPSVSITGGTVTGEVYAVTSKDGSTVERDDQEANAKFAVSGGTFSTKVKEEFIVEGVAEAKIKDTYYVGGTIASHVSSLQAGDTIEVLTGDLTLDGVATGVTVTNNGKGTVTVDGEDVPADGGSITTEEKVDLTIEMTTSFEAPEDNPIMPQEDYIFTLLSSLCAFPGGTVNYSFDVYIPSGHSSSEAKNVVVTDKLPEGFTAKTVSKQNDNVTYSYDSGSNTMTWTIKSIKGTGKSNKVTISVGLGIPEVPTQAGWENYATATLDNGISDSYRSKPSDLFADKQQEKQFYSYFLGLDANGGTDNEDGLPYFFFQIKHQFDVEDITAAPEVTLPFPGDWYYGYAVDADSYGGDPTPDKVLGDDVIFAGWTTTKHEGVQDERPEDIVAEIAEGTISGSYTFKGISVLYAVYAHDADKDGSPDWDKTEPPSDSADLTNLNALLEKAKGLRDASEANKHIQNLEVLNDPISDAEALVAQAPIDKSRQEEVDSAAAELEEALGQLIYNSNVHVSTDGVLTLTSSVMKDDRATGMNLTLNIEGETEDVETVEFTWTPILEENADKYFSATFNKAQGTLRIMITDLGTSRTPIMDLEGNGQTSIIVLGNIQLKNAAGEVIKGTVSVAQDALKYTDSLLSGGERSTILQEAEYEIGPKDVGPVEQYSLTVSNAVSGEGADAELPFQYTITLMKDGQPVEDAPIEFTKPMNIFQTIANLFTPDDNDGAISSGDSFALKSGESITISELPAGTAYTVEQTDEENYTKSVDGAESGTLDDDVTVAYTNEYVEPIAASDSIKIAADGTVTLTSDHMADEEVKTIAVAFHIDPSYPIDQVDLAFTFDSGIKAMVQSAKQNVDDPTLYTIRIAGTEALFAKGTTELTLGKLSVTLKDGGDAVKATVTVAKDGLKYVNGSEITATINPVEAELDGLEFIPAPGPADLNALNAAIAAAKEKEGEADLYSNYADVAAALETAEALAARAAELTENDQEDIDAAAQALDAAVKALAYKPLDTTKLDAALKRAAALDETDDAVEKAWAEAGEFKAKVDELDIRDQADVDAAADALNKAIDDLLAKPAMADYTAVDAAIKTANERIASGLYTDESVALLQQAIDAVQRDKTAEEQAQVDAMAKAIEDATAALVLKPADKTSLQSAVDAAEALDADLYKDFTAMEQAIAAAKALLDDDDASAEDIASAMEALDTASKALEYKDADLTKLEEAIQKAEALKAEDYKDFTPVERALVAAKALLEKENMDIRDQGDIDSAVKALEDAIAALEPVETTSPSPSPSAKPGSGSGGPAAPATGDNNNLVLWGVIAVVCLSGLAIAAILLIRKNRKESASK